MARFVTPLLALLAALCLVAMATIAKAQAPCGPHDRVAADLAERFQEVPAARGVVGEGQATVELFISPSGTWTLLGTDTQKRSCIFAAGDAFEFVPPVVPKGEAM